MKKNIFLHLTIATFFLGLSACTDDNLLPPVENNVPTIDAGLLEDYYFILDTDIPQTHMPQTRVSYINERESYFDEGDEMGIFVINENNELISSANGNATTANVRYKVTNVTNIADNSVRQVIEPVNGPSNRVPRGHRYIIYYPYRANMDFNLITGLTYTVEANQNANETTKTDLQNQGLTAFEASDLLWDVAVDESIEGSDGEKVNYANVKMEHIMAQIILRINDDAVTSETPVNIVNCPLRATGINLSTAALEELQYSSSASTTTGIIRMWYSGLSSSGASQFRAVVPACRTLEAGTALFQINDKTYKISKVLNLQPGKNYIFSIGESGNIEQPELSDDDSWVYDVLDPQTGTPVGLLCREYLRYQASNDKDEMTGTDNGQGSKWINSQAWVFYNLQDDGRTPDLNQGTVLRFIYDIEEIGHGATPVNGTAQANIWPAPHYKMTSGGLFTPLHGYKWGTMYANGYGGEYTGMGTAQDGYDEPIETQYYMHGGVITWDGTNNKIANFTLPDAKITNNEALQGYIAIEDGQKPYIAYQEKEGVRKGIIVEHFLIDTLDTVGHLENVRTEYFNAFKEWTHLRKHLENLRQQAQQDRSELDYMQYQLQQLEEAQLEEGEQEKLEEEAEVLNHTEDIKQSLFTASNLINGEEQNTISALRSSIQLLESIRDIFKPANELAERLESVRIELKDIVEELEQAQERMDFDPERLSFVNERLNLIYTLQNKHRVENITALLNIANELREKIDSIENIDEHIAEYEEKEKSLHLSMIEKGRQLTASRIHIANDIATELIHTLQNMGMPEARLHFEISERVHPDASGLDNVRFLFNANKNAAEQDVAQIASGGEIARLMLALKSLISKYRNLPTIIFDEIDTGVSGTIAEKMAHVMLAMAQNCQVLCITHLPQIAAMGTNHYKVYKTNSPEGTSSHIIRLTTDERIKEIANMLSGEIITEAAINNTKSLLRL